MLNLGDVISSRYELIRVLGQGGMSNIYLCRDRHLAGKECVLKELTATFSSAGEQALAQKQFEMEALLLAKLEHPNLPRVSDYFLFQGHPCLVMDYVAGEDLEKIITRSPSGLPEKMVAEYAIQVATVLYYLHMQKPHPIVFRDLKPSNIMLSGGIVKLIDFGIARLYSPAKKGDTLRIGSPGYAPPEQYGGQTDPRSDIFSLGVVMHRLLTRSDPASTQTPFSFVPVRKLNPAVSGNMEAIINRATQADPNRRYQSVLDLKKDLLDLLKPQGASPRPQPPPPMAGTPPRTAPRKNPFRFLSLIRWIPYLLILTILLSLLFYEFIFPLALKYYPDLPPLFYRNKTTLPGGSHRDLALFHYSRGDYRKALDESALALALDSLDGLSLACKYNCFAMLSGRETIQVGVSVPLTGEDRSSSRRMLMGAALAQRRLNGGGGILGRKVILLIKDDASTAGGAEKAALSLKAAPSLKAVMGNHAPPATIASARILNEAKILQISPTASRPEAAFLDKMAFGIGPDVSRETEILAALAAGEGAGSAAVLSASPLYESQARDLLKSMNGAHPTKNSFLAGAEDPDFNLADFRKKAEESGARIVLLGDTFETISRLCRGLRNLGYSSPVLANHAFQMGDLPGKLSDLGEVLFPTVFSPFVEGRETAIFLGEFEAATGCGKYPDCLTALSYDALLLIAGALNGAGGDPVRAAGFLAGAAGENQFEGATGKISFKGGHFALRKWNVLQIKEGILSRITELDLK
jgi:serine/threonine protein kinase/ABC-type branched-subunit amino acid transport system substrate-binding protein